MSSAHTFFILDAPESAQMSDRATTLARAVMRWWLPLKERKSKKALEDAFEIIKIETLKSEQRPFKASATILNIALYLLLAERDIQSFKIEALTHPDEWKRKLCARVILLTIHELNLDRVSGAALRNALEISGASEELRKETTQALRALRAVQEMARKEFGPLRNAVIAHRDPNALLQYQAICDLDTDKVFRISGEFYAAVRQFLDMLPKLMSQAGNMPALLLQWIDAEGRKS